MSCAIKTDADVVFVQIRSDVSQDSAPCCNGCVVSRLTRVTMVLLQTLIKESRNWSRTPLIMEHFLDLRRCSLISSHRDASETSKWNVRGIIGCTLSVGFN